MANWMSAMPASKQFLPPSNVQSTTTSDRLGPPQAAAAAATSERMTILRMRPSVLLGRCDNGRHSDLPECDRVTPRIFSSSSRVDSTNAARENRARHEWQPRLRRHDPPQRPRSGRGADYPRARLPRELDHHLPQAPAPRPGPR